VRIIDQTRLPHRFETILLADWRQAVRAIREMQVRGAPLIGATAAWGVALAMRDDASNEALMQAFLTLKATRPTAINLAWALERMCAYVAPLPPSARYEAAAAEAQRITDEDVAINERIGRNGLPLIEAIAGGRRGPVNILTHCNAGWLATVDWGTATAPIYMAHDRGIPLHVWVDETRPRNQGAFLTAWELGRHGVPHTVIADNAGGHLMQRGQVDMVMVGTDRVTAQGDVCNKIGTYLKALAARDSGVPFYVALPTPTLDMKVSDGLAEIPIEERSGDEVRFVEGLSEGAVRRVDLLPEGSRAANPAFDVTPARLVTALVTEKGVVPASREGIAALTGPQ
jgi:methylthioribose-1-phosphate isomerase